MKILFLANYDPFRPRTNQISDLRFCEGFAENGIELNYVAPFVYRKNNLKYRTLFESYGIKFSYKMTILWTPLIDDCSKFIALPILFAYYTGYLFFYSIYNIHKEYFIISRYPYILLINIFFVNLFRKKRKIKNILWAHEICTSHKIYDYVYTHVDGIIGTNSYINRQFREKYGINQSRLVISLNPISSSQINNVMTKQDARQILNIKDDVKLAVYTGKLYTGQKEIEYILEAAKQLKRITFLFTGGKPDVVRHYLEFCEIRGISNTFFTGFIEDYKNVQIYQIAADVLISYYTRQDHLVEYNYPQKITEYMLSGNPIVTPNFEATRDVLNGKNAIFVQPENVDSLVQGLNLAIFNPEFSNRIGQQAREDVQLLTFKNMTTHIIQFLNKL